MPHSTPVLQRIADALLAMDADAVQREMQTALTDGLAPLTIITDGLSHGMRIVGAKFRDGEVFMPEVLVCCDVYQAGLAMLQPLIAAGTRTTVKGKMILGTIHGDIHSVGKDVAIPVFRAAGFEVVDLGIDVADSAFVTAIQDHQPDIVGLGTYMTSTFMHTHETVAAIARAGLRDQVKIICGGPAVDANAARKMGADDAIDNAWEGVRIMEAWMAEAAS